MGQFVKKKQGRKQSAFGWDKNGELWHI